jgi:serine/threonine-protein kinase
VAAPSVLTPGTELSDYCIIERVGRGASAYVYKAKHLHLPMLVAIKQLRPELVENQDALRRFQQEAEIVAQLNHPNVVHIHTLICDPATNQRYIVTEFAQEGTLAGLLVKHPDGLPIDQALRITADICKGLDAVHRKGIVHRDVKPSNVLLFKVEGDAHYLAKVCDFGISKESVIPDVASLSAPSSSRSQTLGAIGTFHYMSPEQFDEETAFDHRSDVYSVGILLYELLTGQVPFMGDVLEVVRGHTCAVPEPPSKARPDIPKVLEQIVLRAVSKTPQKRYQSAGDMFRALQRVFIEPTTQRMSMDGVIDQNTAALATSPEIAVLVIEDGHMRREYVLGFASVVIGRASECDVVINDNAVSRRHIRLSYETDHFAIYDLGSSNGTLVNGQRISNACVLADGDRIQIGGTVLAFRELIGHDRWECGENGALDRLAD